MRYMIFLQVPIESGKLDNLLYFELDDAVIGTENWYGFRYNQQEKLEVIPLNDEGESGYKNQNETAQEIGQWLKSVLHEYQYYDQ